MGLQRVGHDWVTEQQQINKESSYATCNNMDGHTDYDTKQNKSEKDKYHIISFICGIWSKTQISVCVCVCVCVYNWGILLYRRN